MIFFDDDLSLEGFQKRFHSEDVCVDALFKIKWPKDFRCSICQSKNFYTVKTRRLPLYQCCDCGHQHSIIEGTVMERSRTDLRKWFLTFYMLSRVNANLNAFQLHKLIKVTYKTAWLMLCKIRAVLSHADQQVKLSGKVRINPATYGRSIHSELTVHPQEHPLLIAAAMDNSEQHNYIKIKQMNKKFLNGWSVNKPGARYFIENNVDKSVQPADVECITQRFNRKRCKKLSAIAKSAETWINDTFHGIGAKHLQKYLDEFCYRINLSLAHMTQFPSLLQLCAFTPAATYKQLTKPTPVNFKIKFSPERTYNRKYLINAI